ALVERLQLRDAVTGSPGCVQDHLEVRACAVVVSAAIADPSPLEQQVADRRLAFRFEAQHGTGVESCRVVRESLLDRVYAPCEFGGPRVVLVRLAYLAGRREMVRQRARALVGRGRGG